MIAATTCGASNMTTAKMPSVDEIMRLMDDLKRRFPDADRCSRIALSPSVYVAADKLIQRDCPQPCNVHSLYSIPFGLEHGLPDGSIREYMADGSSVLTYASGRTVRCLKEPDDSPWSDEKIMSRMEERLGDFIHPSRLWSRHH